LVAVLVGGHLMRRRPTRSEILHEAARDDDAEVTPR
jgi:hypothetical protein